MLRGWLQDLHKELLRFALAVHQAQKFGNLYLDSSVLRLSLRGAFQHRKGLRHLSTALKDRHQQPQRGRVRGLQFQGLPYSSFSFGVPAKLQQIVRRVDPEVDVARVRGGRLLKRCQRSCPITTLASQVPKPNQST